MTGKVSNWWNGGGLDRVHSSVVAPSPHGLPGAFLPAPSDQMMLIKKMTMWKAYRANGFHGFFQWVYPSRLKGCPAPVRIVERQGLVGGIELRNYLLPEIGRALIMFSRHRPTGLGDPWEGKGFAFDLLSKVECR